MENCNCWQIFVSSLNIDSVNALYEIELSMDLVCVVVNLIKQ